MCRSTLAIALAERDWDVLVVDRDTFPSETVSTHFVYPNTVSRFEQLGVSTRSMRGTTCRWWLTGSSAWET